MLLTAWEAMPTSSGKATDYCKFLLDLALGATSTGMAVSQQRGES